METLAYKLGWWILNILVQIRVAWVGIDKLTVTIIDMRKNVLLSIHPLLLLKKTRAK